MYNTAYKASGKLADNNMHVIMGKYEGNGLTVLQHDVCQKHIPPDFERCDAIHSELAWQKGYTKFTENTIAKDTTFDEYLEAIRNLCHALNIPAFIVCGKQMLYRLRPDNVIPITYKFHNYPAFYAIYNHTADMDGVKDEYEGRDWVCRNYNTILDPCCGYGIIANEILRYSKEGVLSDINSECLKYIKKTYIGGHKDGENGKATKKL